MFQGERRTNKSFTLKGGLDLIGSYLDLPPGKLIACNGVEIRGNENGYHRPDGYERCCDDVLPSDTALIYWTIENAAGGAIAVDDDFTCAATSTTIKSLEANASPQDDDYMVFATHGTSFTAGDTFTDGTVSFDLKAQYTDISQHTRAEIQAFLIQAIEQTRDAIPVVTGSGVINGIFRLAGDVYAFRNGGLYKGADYAWSAVTMPDILYFSAGTAAFNVGATVTDGTATATVAAVVVQSGAWGDNDAAGYLTITGVASGPFTTSTALSDNGGTPGAATSASANSTYSLTAGGRFGFKKHNFTNVANADCMYGWDGVNEAFQFDGTNYIPIFHPDTSDPPSHGLIHQERLYLAFPGGEWAYSVSGIPTSFDSLLGAGTWSVGAEIVGNAKIQGNAAAVWTAEDFWILTGDGTYTAESASREWSFYKHGDNLGAEEWSIAGHSDYIFFDGGDLFSIKTTDAYGDFSSNPLTNDIKPFLDAHRGLVTAAIFVKAKSQYRIFFSDDKAAYVTFSGGKLVGATPMTIPHGVNCAYVYYEDSEEYIYFGSDDGYVYRMDSGSSFDDEAITGSMRLPFYPYGNPRQNKQFQQMILELSAPVLLTDNTELSFTVNFNHGSPESPRPIAETRDALDGAGGFYGSNDGYGNFVWSGPSVSEVVAYLEGYGYNMSILISFSSQYDSGFAFLSVTTDFIPLGTANR